MEMIIKNINRFYMIMMIGMLFVILGMEFQFEVNMANNGKMPIHNNSIVQSHFQEVDVSKYIVYNDKSEINKYWLSDIIPFFNQGYFSIGDLFMYWGIMICFGNLAFHLAESYKLKKRQKKINKVLSYCLGETEAYE